MTNTKTKKELKPAVDAEVEAATGATVTTSTVKHDVTAKITVQEVELNEENGNPGDPIHDPEGTKKLEAIFAEATPLIDVDIVNGAEIDASDKDDSDAAELTEEGKNMLNDCETKITKGLSTFVEVGAALSIININHLFKPPFRTWEEYLDNRWGFTRQRAHQYMQAADGYQKLSTQIAIKRKLPESERAMRELLKAPKGKVIDILDKLGDEGELTAERIIKVREEVAPKKAPKKAKKKPAIKIENALKAAGVWAAYLAACDLGALTEKQREALKEANKSASEKFNKLSIAA